MPIEPALTRVMRMPYELVLERAEYLNPRIYNSQERDRQIGDFFTNLTVGIFNGTKLPQSGVQTCDAHLKDLNAFCEIKGRSDAYALPLKEHQHESNLEIGDALDVKPDVLYAVWRYRSLDRPNRGGKRVSLLTKMCKDWRSLNRFLGCTTHTCHLLDIGVVEAVRKEFGIRPYTWRSNQTDSVIYLPESRFQGLHEGTIKGVSPRLARKYRFGTFHFHVLWGGVGMIFKIRTILLPRTFRLLAKVARKMDGQLFIPGS